MSDLHTLLTLPYGEDVRPAIYTDGTPCYLAEIPDLPGCFAYGRTMDEASAALQRARVAYITHRHENELHIPLPGSGPNHRWQWESVTEEASGYIGESAVA